MPVVTPTNADAACAICFEPNNAENGEIWRLACGHSFHFHCACLAPVVDSNSRAPCPLCRSEISATNWDDIRGDSSAVSVALRNMRGQPGAPRGFIVGRQFTIDRQAVGRLTTDEIAGRNSQVCGEGGQGGCDHRNALGCMLHLARVSILQASSGVTHEIRENTIHFCDILAGAAPRPEFEPHFQYLRQALVHFAGGEQGELQVDEVDVVWQVSPRLGDAPRPPTLSTPPSHTGISTPTPQAPPRHSLGRASVH